MQSKAERPGAARHFRFATFFVCGPGGDCAGLLSINFPIILRIYSHIYPNFFRCWMTVDSEIFMPKSKPPKMDELDYSKCVIAAVSVSVVLPLRELQLQLAVCRQSHVWFALTCNVRWSSFMPFPGAPLRPKHHSCLDFTVRLCSRVMYGMCVCLCYSLVALIVSREHSKCNITRWRSPASLLLYCLLQNKGGIIIIIIIMTIELIGSQTISHLKPLVVL